MNNEKLFLGPGSKLIIPFRSSHSFTQNFGHPLVITPTYSNYEVPWGYWYIPYPFEITRKASYLEIYIMSNYKMCGPNKQPWS